MGKNPHREREKVNKILTIAYRLDKFSLRVRWQMRVVCGIFGNVRPKMLLGFDSEACQSR